MAKYTFLLIMFHLLEQFIVVLKLNEERSVKKNMRKLFESLSIDQEK